MRSLIAAITLIWFVGAASGQSLRVAIVAAATNTADEQNSSRFTDPRDKLVSTGLFDSVTIISTTRFGGGHTPTLDELLQYDSILIWSNDSHDDSVALGNVVADYVDAGGGVVHAVFGNTSTNPDRQLLGRWEDEEYYLIPPRSGWQGANRRWEMGDVLEPDHPIMEGVEEFASFGESAWGAFRPNTRDVMPWARKIALWEDDASLVVVGDNPRIVELGMHPVSSAVNALGYWDETTDGALLMGNALVYVATEQGCAADLDGDGDADADDFFGYLDAFAAGNLGVCDIDGDGDCDADDFFSYLDRFAVGC